MLLDYLSGADILAYLAVLADLGVDAGMGCFFVNCTIGAVSLAVAAKGASGGAILCLLCRSILAGAGNHLHSLVGQNGDKVLGACIGAVAAANALALVNAGNTVYNADGAVAAYLGALAAAEAAGSADAMCSQVKLGSLLAGGDAHFFEYVVCSAVAVAAYKGNASLELGKIVGGVNNDLLAALNGAGNAAHALIIVDDSVVVDHLYRVLGTSSLALAAGNAAIAADASDQLIIFFGGGARDKG